MSYIDILNFIQSQASTIIALCALVVTIHQLRQSQKFNVITLRPNLVFELLQSGENGTSIIAISLFNSGLGPAIIRGFSLFFKNELVTNGNHQLIQTHFNGTFKGLCKRTSYSSLQIGFMMPSKDRTNLVHLTFEEKPESMAEIIKLLDMYELKIEYESVYGQKLILASNPKKFKPAQ